MATERQVAYMSYHMRHQLKRVFPSRMEEWVLPNGMTQSVDMRFVDFTAWAKTLSTKEASKVIALWSEEKEEEALNLLLSYKN
jgi:hypothetical protein